MNRPRLIIIVTVGFWLVVGGLVVRTNRLWFGPVTFRWNTLSQPNAMFRWTAPPSGRNILIPANSTKSFKIQVPKKFRQAELLIATAPGQGVLIAEVNARAGKANTTGRTPAGGTLRLPLSWDSIAVQNRSFNVDLLSDAHDLIIQAITLQLQ